MSASQVDLMRALHDEHAPALWSFAGVHVAPDSSADIADGDQARLVILHPMHPHSRGDASSAAMRFAEEAFTHRGSAQRTNRNMVVFLAPDSKRLDELADAARDYLAWEWVSQRVQELNLSPQQVTSVQANKMRSDEAVTARIAEAYHWALVPEQPDPAQPAQIAVEKADGATERLAERVTDKLRRAGLLTDQIAPRSIRLELEQRLGSVWTAGHLRGGELRGYFCRYPYLTRLRDRSVLDDGVRAALDSFTWEAEAFALAESYNQASGRYEGLVLPGASAQFGQITDATLLVTPSAALAQVGPVSPPPGPGVVTPPVIPPVVPPPPAPPAPPAPTYRVDPERYGRDLTRLSQEILQPLAAVDGVQLEVTIEVRAVQPEGFPDDKVRVVLENARTLKFQQSSFEDG